MPRSAASKPGKFIQMFTDFTKGWNTASAPHLLGDNETPIMQNVSIDIQGSVSKRRGFTSIAASLGVGKLQSLYAYRKQSTRTMLAVFGGKLYKYVTASTTTLLGTGAWVNIPIRRHSPQAVLAVMRTTGTPGANIVASTVYDYAVLAKDTTGSTVLSTVSRVTQVATTRPVDLIWDAVLGATSYDVYRNGKLIISLGNVTVWLDDGSVAPTATNPPAANTTELTTTIDPEFITWNDKCYFTTGNGICMYDGVADASLVVPYVPTSTETTAVGTNDLRNISSTIHACKYLKIHWNYMVVCGDPTYKQNVYYTDLGLSPVDGSAWFPPSHSFDVTTDNGEAITGVINFRDALVFFTRASIHTLFGTQHPGSTPSSYDFILRPTNLMVGAESHRSICLVDNFVVFVSTLGIYALKNVVASDTYMNVQSLSNRIEPDFLKLMNKPTATAVYHDHQYKVCFPGDNTVFRWYSSKDAWAQDTAPKVSDYVVWDTDLYMASYTNGMVYKHGVKSVSSVEVDCYNDNGAAIPMRFLTKSYDLGSLVNTKKVKKMFILGKQQAVVSTLDVLSTVDYTTLLVTVNFNESTVLGDPWELGIAKLGWVDVVFQELALHAKGHQLYFEFNNNNIDEPVTLYGVGILFKVKPTN